MKALSRNHIILTIIWSLLLWPFEAYSIMDCSLAAARMERTLRENEAFTSYKEFQKFEAQAIQLLQKGSTGRSRLQIELSKPGVTIESLIPQSAIGTAAFYQAFANHGNSRKVVDIGKVLTGEANLPPGAAREVAQLKQFLMDNPFIPVRMQTGTNGQPLLIPVQKNAKWYQTMKRFATLTATIQQYARLGEIGGAGTPNGRSWHSKLVASKLTSGFMRFLKKRSGAEVQRHLVETQLSRSNFAEALEIMGLYNKNANSVRFRQGMEKYSNFLANTLNAAFFGATLVGTQAAANSFGLPINIYNMIGGAWLAAGFIPLHYRYKMPLGSAKTREILESVRRKGYEKGIEPFRRTLFVHRGVSKSSTYVRRAMTIALLLLVTYFVNEYGETVWNGIITAAAMREILMDPEKLATAEAQMTNEDIRTEILEAKCLEFPIVFSDEYDIHPNNRYEWDRYLRSVAYCKSNVLPEMVDHICKTKDSNPVQGWEAQESFINAKYDQIIQENDLVPQFVKTSCAEQVFWLWQDADIDRDIRFFSEGSDKPEIDFCKGQSKPTIFKSTDFQKRLRENLGY